jgi:hypothetical protein
MPLSVEDNQPDIDKRIEFVVQAEANDIVADAMTVREDQRR